MKFIQRFSVYFLLLLMFLACDDDDKPTTITDPPINSTQPVSVPRFDRDSAFNFVAKQTEFGPRVPNTEAHRQAKDWLVGKLEAFGTTVIEQSFEVEAYTGEMLQATNIIGQYNPESEKRVILAAHWDSRHIADHDPDEANRKEYVMGADDGASGVGVLLEIARQLQANPIDMGVDIILFDVEDQGDGGENGDYTTWCLGAQHWARNPHKPNYRAEYGILLDMVGAENARFTKEEVSMTFAPDLMNHVWQLAQDMGYGNYFVNEKTRQIIDDHLFVNQIAKIPMIDIINRPSDTETMFVAHWHTVEDTIDKIDKQTLRAVGQVVLAVIYREAGPQPKIEG